MSDPILEARLEAAAYHSRMERIIERMEFARRMSKSGRIDLALQEMERTQQEAEEIVALGKANMKRRQEQAYASVNMMIEQAGRVA